MRLLGVLTAVLVIACAAIAGLSSAASTALPRATEDRPDEVAGEQVHFLYVIPTDAPDEQLDVNGELNASIARMQAWLAGQTGGPKLRLDTFQGQPDITFVRTSVAYDPDQGIRRYVERLGFTNPKKLYLAYLGTYEDATACGRGSINAGVVFLSCTSQLPSGPPFSFLDAVAMHEALHALGAVPDGAPNGYDGHVRDPSDIMNCCGHQIDQNGQVTALLDPGRDDYYGHSRTRDIDVADSHYLDSNPISVPPKMRVGSVVAQKRERVNRGRLTVRASVSNPGTGRVTVQCSAKQGKRRLRVVASQYSRGSVRCSFAGVRRGPVSGQITVRSGQTVASRPFRVRA